MKQKNNSDYHSGFQMQMALFLFAPIELENVRVQQQFFKNKQTER